MTTFPFTCPYCGKPTTITDPNYFESWTKFCLNNPIIEKMLPFIDKKDLEGLSGEDKQKKIQKTLKPDIGIFTQAITCPDPKCNKLWLNCSLWNAYNHPYHGWKKGAIQLWEWQLLPESEAKVLPNYIPTPISEDYYEACRIRDLSPKASATLSRRCLQGMIRDFWGIKKNRLIDEINALEEKVDPLVWDSIDAVRKVGNIGAHMEKDINLITEVSPKESQLLIQLIEQLVEDWYVSKHDREERLNQTKNLANKKTKNSS